MSRLCSKLFFKKIKLTLSIPVLQFLFLWWEMFRCPVPATAGSLNHKNVAGVQQQRAAVAKRNYFGQRRHCRRRTTTTVVTASLWLAAAAGASLDPVRAHFPWKPSAQAKGGHLPSVGENRHRHGLQKLDPALDALSAFELTLTPGPAAKAEALHEQREAELEDLGVGEPRVGHVAVHRVAAVKPVPRPRAPTDGLVVVHPLWVAEGEVVHGALAARHCA
mmetsp:Transcript_10947/g.18593  ORF Transcript_10947/g.18593 Transcript_10947/m.18593 type:complete len:220 (-) Transcript_10947:357-1016(-)